LENKIWWQSPNSPELNELDLGTWMVMQSEVGQKHKDCHMKVLNILAKSVEESFLEYDSVKQIIKIDLKWQENLILVVLGKGSNNLIEKKEKEFFFH
jgi:hypothetical protein